MKKILVATDFSACSHNAMEYAMELARIVGAEVTAIHAIGSFEGIFNNTYNALYIEDYHNNKREALKSWANSFATREVYSSVPVSTASDIGSVSGVITKYIDSNPVELLVMGTMGATGITGIFGSNASNLVEKARTPSLIIPLESKFTRQPTITLATDFSTKLSSVDVNALHELAIGVGTEKLNIVNIIEGNEWQANHEGEEALRKMLPSAQLEFNYIKEDSPIEGIINFIVSSATDILCLVKRHHGLVYRIFNTSTVNKVMNRSIKAILVLHE